MSSAATVVITRWKMYLMMNAVSKLYNCQFYVNGIQGNTIYVLSPESYVKSGINMAIAVQFALIKLNQKNAGA